MPRKGFTLVEMLIATSLFAIAAVIASTILVNVVQLEKKGSTQNAVYHDLRILMQQLSNEIQGGTIDYEEYYNMEVIQLLDPDNNPSKRFYGVHYGVYASRFFDPGKSLKAGVTLNPADLGVECSYPKNLAADKSCEIYFTNSNDINAGLNPYNTDGTGANAFCDNSLGNAKVNCAQKVVGNGNKPVNHVHELYLIDNTGTKKTIIARKAMGGGDYSMGMVKMNGKDLDQNGIVDVFGCAEEYQCFQANEGLKIANEIKYGFISEMLGDAAQNYLVDNGISLPQKSDLEAAFIPESTQFIPISPQILSVKDLTFVINPIENPYIAFGEKAVQMHPSVTIFITVGLSKAAEEDYPGDFEDFTVQTTVAAGLIGKLDSYPPVNDVLKPRWNGPIIQKDTSWIDAVL